MGKFLIIAGIILIAAGLLIQSGAKLPFFGKLSGDIRVEKNNFTFYFPLASSILISIILSLIIYFFNRGKGQ